jgi:hypothetical protein
VIIFKDLKYQIFYKNKLPIGLLPTDYGYILHQKDNIYTIRYNNKVIIILETFPDKNIVQYIKNNTLMYKWTDKIIDSMEGGSNNKFIRTIGKSSYEYHNKELVLVKTIKKTNPLKSI